MQLLKITTTPIEYKLEVEHASLQAAENQPGITESQPEALIPKVPAQHARKDSGFSRFHAEGRQPAENAPTGYGPAVGGTAAGVTPGNGGVAPDRAAGRKPAAGEAVQTATVSGLDAAIAQIPSGLVDRSWEPKEGMLEEATPLADNKRQMEYHPGDVSISIEKMPEVDIEYVGEPQYFPRSADPDYEPEE